MTIKKLTHNLFFKTQKYNFIYKAIKVKEDWVDMGKPIEEYLGKVNICNSQD